MRITILNYGLSNILSVKYAFLHCGANVVIADKAEEVFDASALVLPGVGNFGDGMLRLERQGLIEPLRKKVLEGIPLLGICLGMQMLFEESEENGVYRGLGLIPGKVVRIPAIDVNGEPQHVPHIGWAPLYPTESRDDFVGTVLDGVSSEQEFYFIHSYEAKPTRETDCLAVTQYGGRSICAIVACSNVWGMQFHPEKSGSVGLDIINNFLKICRK